MTYDYNILEDTIGETLKGLDSVREELKKLDSINILLLQMQQMVKGKKSEEKCRTLLYKNGLILQQPDIYAKRKDGNSYLIVEVKQRSTIWEHRKNGFRGFGIPRNQVQLRSEVFKNTGQRTLIMIDLEQDGQTYYQFLDVLLKGEIEEMRSQETTMFHIGGFKIWEIEPLDDNEPFVIQY